jgi:hypothetical protein
MGYDTKTNTLHSLYWEDCPEDVQELTIDCRDTLFSWNGCPKSLKSIKLYMSNLKNFSWYGCPEGLQKIEIFGCLTKFDWYGCPKKSKK